MNTNILGDFQICNSVSLRTPFSIEHPWLLLRKWLFSGVFKQQHGVELSVTVGSHRMLEKKKNLTKGKWEGSCLLNQVWGKEAHI